MNQKKRGPLSKDFLVFIFFPPRPVSSGLISSLVVRRFAVPGAKGYRQEYGGFGSMLHRRISGEKRSAPPDDKERIGVEVATGMEGRAGKVRTQDKSPETWLPVR